MQKQSHNALLKNFLSVQRQAYFPRKKFVLFTMRLLLMLVLGGTITVSTIPIELGDHVMASAQSSDQNRDNPSSAAGQAQGQSVHPQSTPPDAARESQPSEINSISIGVPISPEEYRRLKERATHPTQPNQESGSGNSQAGNASADMDESQH